MGSGTYFRVWYNAAMAVQAGAADNLVYGMVVELERELFYLLWELSEELQDPVTPPGTQPGRTRPTRPTPGRWEPVD